MSQKLRQDDPSFERRLVVPRPAERGWLARAHSMSWINAVLSASVGPQEERKLGFKVDAAMARRALAATGGTVLSARLALDDGFAANTAGGSHHAHRDAGAGFCIFNDVAVASCVLLGEGLVQRILVVDLDVHQGDGTADILGNNPDVFTLSVHCRANYPAHKKQSSLDIALDAGTPDEAYLSLADRLVPSLLERVQPDLVFFNAGVDPHVDDRLGRMALTDQGLLARERMILTTCLRHRVPVVGVMGGGYDDDIERLVARHALLHVAAREIFG